MWMWDLGTACSVHYCLIAQLKLNLFVSPKHGLQEFGSPTKNGLGHAYTTTLHPVTQKPIRAVFIPKFKAGTWSGSVGNMTAVEDTSILDNDETALRKNQLSSP